MAKVVIPTQHINQAQELAAKKQAQQEAKAIKAIKISGIDIKDYDASSIANNIFEAHLSNGKSAIFNMSELLKFEKVDPANMAEFDESFSVEILTKIYTSHKSVSEVATDKMLASHHIEKADFVKFLVEHVTDDHA